MTSFMSLAVTGCGCQRALVSWRRRSVSVIWIFTGTPGRPPTLSRHLPSPGGGPCPLALLPHPAGEDQEVIRSASRRDSPTTGVQVAEFGAGQPQAGDHPGPLDEPPGLGPVGAESRRRPGP